MHIKFFSVRLLRKQTVDKVMIHKKRSGQGCQENPYRSGGETPTVMRYVCVMTPWRQTSWRQDSSPSTTVGIFLATLDQGNLKQPRRENTMTPAEVLIKQDEPITWQISGWRWPMIWFWRAWRTRFEQFVGPGPAKVFTGSRIFIRSSFGGFLWTASWFHSLFMLALSQNETVIKTFPVTLTSQRNSFELQSDYEITIYTYSLNTTVSLDCLQRITNLQLVENVMCETNTSSSCMIG